MSHNFRGRDHYKEIGTKFFGLGNSKRMASIFEMLWSHLGRNNFHKIAEKIVLSNQEQTIMLKLKYMLKYPLCGYLLSNKSS